MEVVGMDRVVDGAKRAESGEPVEPPRAEVLRAQLRHVAGRLREATRASERAGYSRLPGVLTDEVEAIELLLQTVPLPPAEAIEVAIGHAERIVGVWHALSTF